MGVTLKPLLISLSLRFPCECLETLFISIHSPSLSSIPPLRHSSPSIKRCSSKLGHGGLFQPKKVYLSFVFFCFLYIVVFLTFLCLHVCCLTFSCRFPLISCRSFGVLTVWCRVVELSPNLVCRGFISFSVSFSFCSFILTGTLPFRPIHERESFLPVAREKALL